jgi:hypothetical protein
LVLNKDEGESGTAPKPNAKACCKPAQAPGNMLLSPRP